MSSPKTSPALVESATTALQEAASPSKSREINLEIATLNRKILDLKHAAAAAREEELADIISKVRLMLSEFEMTDEELNSAFGVTTAGALRQKSTLPEVNFVGPNGEQWGGGRGPRPKWVKDALNLGHKLDDFRVVPVPNQQSNHNGASGNARTGAVRWRTVHPT
jgi:DNA-binding protein H-NS